ncbi:hypothetical protein HK405_006479, partial [Cladochytrium tenue]
RLPCSPIIIFLAHLFLPFQFLPFHRPSRLPASPLVARRRASSSPPKPPASRPPPLAVSRSLTVTARVPSPSVRSVATRSRPSSLSASCPSSAWCVRSPRTSRRTCASRARPSARCRRPQRRTSSASLRTQTWLPSTPSASRSSQRTSSSLAGSVARGRTELSGVIFSPTQPFPYPLYHPV